jgi:hypothetical protein
MSGMGLVGRYRDLISAGHVDEALEFLAPDGSTLVLAELKAVLSGPRPQFDQLTLETLPTGLHDVGKGRYLGQSDQVFRWKETGEISNVEQRAMLYEVGAGKIRKMKFFTQPAAAGAETGLEPR